MSPDLQGTGDEFLSVDLGALGTLVVADDGDPDRYVKAYIEAPNGDTAGVGSTVYAWRCDRNDDAVLAAVEGTGAHPDEENVSRQATQRSQSSSGTSRPRGFFVCDECTRTWPMNRNQTYDEPGPDKCHECAEDDDGDA